MTDQRTVFKIPEANLPRLEREVAKLSKKAQKFGGWEFSLVIFGVEYRDNANGSKTKLYEVSLDVDVIKMGDWSFVARIDHSNETGNVLRVVPNATIEERFRHSAPNCEHCNHKRKRRDTFVLLNNETGEMKQVGSTCLSDFLGHDAAHLGRVAELAGYAAELAASGEREPTESFGLNDHRYVGLADYLAYAALSVRTKGWVSGKAAYANEHLTSTKNDALDLMHTSAKLEQADIDTADAALEWAQAFADKETLSDYEHNVLVIANAAVIEYRSCGIAASIVGVYDMKHTPKAQPIKIDNMEPILTLFKKADNSRVRTPKLVLELGTVGLVEMYACGERSNAPGAINIKRTGWDAPWFGRIHLDGRFQPSKIAPVGIEQELLTFAADPAGMAAQHGHKTGKCCFCNRKLTDARSLAVGYGSTCATNWELPWNAPAELVETVEEEMA